MFFLVTFLPGSLRFYPQARGPTAHVWPALTSPSQLDLAAASSRLEARLRYGLQRWARSATSAASGR